MDKQDIRRIIENGQAILGIELGSTRIKAVLIDEEGAPLCSGAFDWENQFENGIWTYSQDMILQGLTACYVDLKKNVEKEYGVRLTHFASMGVSAMMHGYMPFDAEGNLLVPFRTWRNNITQPASEALTAAFQFAIPQRWSIAHLYQAILNGENHLNQIAYLTTLEGYVHFLLTGQKVLGIGEASGMFPIDTTTGTYDARMVGIFNEMIAPYQLRWTLLDIMPKVLGAGINAGFLTKEGAALLDPSGELCSGIPLCPPEGDVDTGMVATNCLLPGHMHISAGTSAFANVVLDKPLEHLHPELEMAVTPAGTMLAMVHSNNCTTELNAWVGLFHKFTELLHLDLPIGQVYETLYKHSLQGDPDGGGLLSYGYASGEHVTGFESGRPLFARSAQSHMNLANFIRTQIYTSVGALAVGLNVLKTENVHLDHVVAQGGLFKTPEVGQRALAAATGVSVSVMENAGEGGAWGMALLALYMLKKEEGEALSHFLQTRIFSHATETTIQPTQAEIDGYMEFLQRYQKGLPIERAAVDSGTWAE